ncbi:hypothetical protein ZIOFF_018002 [Zingiber officinale]|uniref:Glucan endo-1,3-beta-D-glucosidase n=1 Tax=Zingiber officinale TaxID=94328 RepID=A0A8J5HKD8_ZINOF|nr:hypothetical protein ZIOFF_018002 [Zingiber officinale]
MSKGDRIALIPLSILFLPASATRSGKVAENLGHRCSIVKSHDGWWLAADDRLDVTPCSGSLPKSTSFLVSRYLWLYVNRKMIFDSKASPTPCNLRHQSSLTPSFLDLDWNPSNNDEELLLAKDKDNIVIISKGTRNYLVRNSKAMAMRNIHYSSIAIVVLIVSTAFMVPTRVSAIGVCYGRVGNNLPPPPESGRSTKTCNDWPLMFRRLKIGSKPIYSPHIGNVNFPYINVGNEIIPSDMAQFILPAMCNVQSALLANNINTIKVTTSVAMTVLGASYPPSAGDFTVAAKVIISPIVHFLAANEAPLLVNIYPYFAYKDNSKDISLDYALFKETGVIVQDENFGYQNLFDAMLDSVNAAMEKVGGASVGVVVSESGWPSGGDFGAEVNNAGTYNQNLINHVAKGTPKKPEVAIETYLFAMFNENQKGPAELEKFFGLFFPDKTPVYPLKFT